MEDTKARWHKENYVRAGLVMKCYVPLINRPGKNKTIFHYKLTVDSLLCLSKFLPAFLILKLNMSRRTLSLHGLGISLLITTLLEKYNISLIMPKILFSRISPRYLLKIVLFPYAKGHFPTCVNRVIIII